MSNEDLNIDVNLDVDSLEDLRELRKELEKIAEAKEKIERSPDDDDEEDVFDPLDIGRDERSKRPYFPDFDRDRRWFVYKKGDSSKGFDSSIELQIEDLEDMMYNIDLEGSEKSVKFHTESSDGSGGLFGE